MNRRCFLAASVVSASVFMSGCQAMTDDEPAYKDDWSPEIDGEEPTIGSGESTVLNIDASSVFGLYLDPPSSTGLEFNITEASVIPSPDQSLDSYPPKWYWNNCTSVSIVVPIEVDAGSESGEYTYTVSVVNSRDKNSKTVSRDFSIDVSNP